MKAIPMRGRLTGKRIAGFLWAGQGKAWQRKENYFQLEHPKLVSAVLSTSVGAFWIRCYGATCSVTLRDPKGRVLSTAVMALPRGRKK
jgi:hypothetical protein